ncbi:MAG TPA: TetR/AcrR family transcriptional regulator [Anaerolineaceae bacterium]|nr:TetR/AcrR family transcriptional regulator [Anaerolineaceae bacterium]HPN52158.1 TetR/AcrR family transcriptional regulator [Anaerolineaceae bacterium]
MMMTQKRDDILAAAQRLVSQHGFHGTSMSMIAAEAGVGAGTIYNYFPSKDDLMRALFMMIKQDFMQKVMAGVSPDAPLQESFGLMWANIIHYYLDFPDQITFAQQFHHSPYFDRACEEMMNTLLAPLVVPFEKAMSAGVIRPLPLPVLETFTLDVATSLARRHIKGEIILDDTLINLTAALCWSTLSPDSTRK